MDLRSTVDAAAYSSRLNTARLVELALKETARAPKGAYKRRDRAGKPVPAGGAGPAAGHQGGAPLSTSAPKAKPSPKPTVEGEPSEWTKRLLKDAKAWDDKRPEHTCALRAVAPERFISSGRAAEGEMETARRNVDRACLFHDCCRSSRLEAELIEDADKREAALAALYATLTKEGGLISKAATVNQVVVFCGLRHSFLLDVPTFHCRACSESFVPMAVHALAWPSSASVISLNGEQLGYTRWFDADLLDEFARFRSTGNVSALAFAAVMETTYRESSAALARLGRGGRNDAFPLDDRMLLNVHHAYQAALAPNTAEGERGLYFRQGVCKNCPSCSTVQSTVDGPLDQSEHVSVVLDASVTPSTNPSAARAAHAADLQGKISNNFFMEDLRVSAGASVRAAASPAAGGPSTGGRAAGVRPPPRAGGGGPPRLAPKGHNRLHCSRELLSPEQAAAAAKMGGPSTGIVGGVCPHDQPLLGGFLNMKVPENWGMYDRVLERVILDNRVDKIRIVYIDFSCLYQVHFFNEFGERLEALELEACGANGVSADGIEFFVDWLHMQGHVASCRYRNGAMYNTGTGRRIGVGAEVLWSTVWAGGRGRGGPRRRSCFLHALSVRPISFLISTSFFSPLTDQAPFADVPRHGTRPPSGLARAPADGHLGGRLGRPLRLAGEEEQSGAEEDQVAGAREGRVLEGRGRDVQDGGGRVHEAGPRPARANHRN